MFVEQHINPIVDFRAANAKRNCEKRSGTNLASTTLNMHRAERRLLKTNPPPHRHVKRL